MIKWLHHVLNPHCPDCKLEKEESRICNSCETLKYENERLRADNDRLLARILEKPVTEPTVREAPVPLTRPTSGLSWPMRRQMLEAEDRKKAQILASAPKPDSSVADLEAELGVVEKERESNGKTGTS